MKFSSNCPKYTYNRHDEARHNLNKFRRLSTSNVIFNNYLSECGEDNIAHDILLPRFADLDPSVSVDRVKLITKVYKFPDPDNPKKLIRGLYSIWGTKDKELLSEASKSMSNKFPPKMFVCFGYFEDIEIIPIDDYKKKKRDNRKKRYEEIEAGGNIAMYQRDVLFNILNQDPELPAMIGKKIEKKNKLLNLSTREISTILKKYEIEITQVGIAKAIRNLKTET